MERVILVTKNKIQKEMEAMLADKCGMLASVTKISDALGYDRKYVSAKLRSSDAKVFNEGTQKRYFVGEVAEVFCKGVM